MKQNAAVTVTTDECIVDRYDILVALMKSSQTQDIAIQTKLSKLLQNIMLRERITKEYVNTVNVSVSGNEMLLKYIQKNV